MKYTDINSYELACKDQGRDPDARPDYSKYGFTPAQERYHNSVFEFDIISISVNKEDGKKWKPTPDDRRYSVWVNIYDDSSKRSGFGVSFADVDYGVSFAHVASRLTFRDTKRAKHMFDKFPNLYEDILIPQF